MTVALTVTVLRSLNLVQYNCVPMIVFVSHWEEVAVIQPHTVDIIIVTRPFYCNVTLLFRDCKIHVLTILLFFLNDKIF